MDWEKIIQIAKKSLLVIFIIFFIFVVIPKWRQFDSRVMDRVEDLLNMFVKSTLSIAKKSPNDGPNLLQQDIEENLRLFNTAYFSWFSLDQLARAVRYGEELQRLFPEDVRIKYRLAFLYYVQEETSSAKTILEEILSAYPPRNRWFAALSNDEYSFEVKRTLLLLAAIAYNENEFSRMNDYYRQYLKASYKKEVFEELQEADLAEDEVKRNVFYKLSGDGVFSYRKAISELDKLLESFPSDKRLLYELGRNCFELVNLLPLEEKIILNNHINQANDYFRRLESFDPEYHKAEVSAMLEKLLDISKKISA